MANHVSHASLPYPIKNARFTILVPYLDADGDPTDPTTPDTEFSGDAGAFADCAEEVTTITGSNGMGYITLTGAETNYSMLAVAAKVASGPKNTVGTLYPRALAVVESGTAQAGAAGTITLASGAALYDLTGCFVRTTGGTGGGGTGGASNQARYISAYNTGTKVATVTPNWETNPDNTTTYDILLPEGMTLAALKALNPTTPGRTADIASTGEIGIDFDNTKMTGNGPFPWASIIDIGTAQSFDGATDKLRLRAAFSSPDIVGSSIWIYSSTNGLHIRSLVTAWDNTNKDATIDTPVQDPTGTILYVLYATPNASANLAPSVALTAAAVDSIWDEALSGHATAGTAGKAVSDINTSVDTEVAAIKAKTDNLPADTNSTLTTIAGYIDTEVAAIKAKTDNLPVDPADASDIAASFSTVNSTLSTIAGYIDTEVAAIKAKTDNLPTDTNTTLATIAAYIDTEVAAIKAKTDNLPTDPADASDLSALFTSLTTALNTTRYIKNTANQKVFFTLVDSTDHVTRKVGITVTKQRSIDGATSYSTATGTITEVGNGVYYLDTSAADTNGDDIVFRFSAATCDPVEIHLVTAS